MNSVQLIGRATRNPDSISLESGKSMATLTIAVDGVNETSFIPVVMYNKTAEVTVKYVHKGSLIGITGRLRQHAYTTSDGSNRSVIEVICDNLDLLEKKPEEKKSEVKPTKKSKTSKKEKTSKKTKELDSIEVTDDDLPF